MGFLGTLRIARLCQVTPATVAHWIDQGYLKGHRTPTGHRRVDTEDLVAFLREHGMPVPPDLESESPEVREAIVLVEDDKSYGKLLLRAIQTSDLKADVTLAATGMDGLLEIGRVHPSVIVLDYSLPDLNAPEVVERLLAPGNQLDAEVLIVTGGVQDSDVARLHALGVKEIVQKADGIDAVLEAIGKALARQRAD
ncbi:MAG TPA: response regulator [Gemmatimonadales bacterium]|jgi:CheY-like chemotaxis protein|nr:response regulator [Gemmatimonadales bacterium]